LAVSWFTTLVSQTYADVDLRLNLWRGYGNFYGDVELSAASPAPVTYHRVESPNGKIWQNAGSSFDGSFTNLGFSALLDECTNGLWTLMLNVGDPSMETCKFSVDIANVTSNLFGDITLIDPLYGATTTTNPPNIQWSSTSLLPEVYLQVYENNSPYTWGDDATLPGTSTNWTPSAPLSAAEQSLFMYYTSNNFASTTFSVPTNVVGGAAVSGWSAACDLRSYIYSVFNLPGGGGNAALGEAVDAPELFWATGGDEDWFDQTYETSDGIDAAASDLYGYSSAESWIEATVAGPGYLDFSWALFADEGDSLVVEIVGNGYTEDEIYGNWGWDSGSIYISDTGSVTVRWTFYHNDVNNVFSEACLDEVAYYPDAASHEAELDLTIQRSLTGSGTAFNLFPHLNNVSTAAEVESPNGLCSGDDSSASSVNFATLQAAIDECQAGDWILYFDRYSPAEKQYTFTVTVNALSTNDLPPVLILEPADGATGVAANTDYNWLGPVGWSSLFISVYDVENAVNAGSTSLPASTTTWTNGPTLQSTTNRFSVYYSLNGFAGVSISDPEDVSFNPLSYWNASTRLSSRGVSDFVVGGIIPLPVTILQPTIAGGNLGFGFTSQSGATHIVECTTNLLVAPWVLVTNFTGTGGPELVTLPATNPAAFYRIQTQ
jgi:hypothetical protein